MQRENLSREAAGDSPQASSIRPLPSERAVWNANTTLSYSLKNDFFRILRNLSYFPKEKYPQGPRLRRRTRIHLPRKRPKIDQKSIQKSIKFSISFWTSIFPSWGGFGPPSWTHFSTFLSPRSLLDGYQHQKRRIPRNTTKTNTKSTKMPPGHPPKTTQNPPKSLPRHDFFALKFRPRFGIDFGAILGPKMPPLGHTFGDQNRSKKLLKI